MGATSGVEIISASNLVVLLKRARIFSIFNILITQVLGHSYLCHCYCESIIIKFHSIGKNRLMYK